MEDYSDAIAVKISAPRLRTNLIGPDPEVWVSFDKDFDPKDGLPVYSAAEIKLLGSASDKRLLMVNEAKRLMPGSKVVG